MCKNFSLFLIIFGIVIMSVGVWNDFNIWLIIFGSLLFLSSYFFTEEERERRHNKKMERWKLNREKKYSELTLIDDENEGKKKN